MQVTLAGMDQFPVCHRDRPRQTPCLFPVSCLRPGRKGPGFQRCLDLPHGTLSQTSLFLHWTGERLDPLTRARFSRPRSPARLTLAGLFLWGDSGVGWSRMYAQPAPFFIENKEVAIHFLLCRSGHPLSMAIAKYAASQPRSARQQHLPNEVTLFPFRRDGRPRGARVSALRFAEAEKAQSTRRAYATDYRLFCQWCSRRGLKPMSAGAETVAAYLVARSLLKDLRAILFRAEIPAEKSG